MSITSQKLLVIIALPKDSEKNFQFSISKVACPQIACLFTSNRFIVQSVVRKGEKGMRKMFDHIEQANSYAALCKYNSI